MNRRIQLIALTAFAIGAIVIVSASRSPDAASQAAVTTSSSKEQAKNSGDQNATTVTAQPTLGFKSRSSTSN